MRMLTGLRAGWRKGTPHRAAATIFRGPYLRGMTPPTDLEWLLHLASSWALFGLIWTVQLVHYPSFRYVPDFTEFHPHHTSSITLIVLPLMLLELAVTGWLAYRTQFAWPYLVPLVLVILIWANTFFQAVPLHNALGKLRSDADIESLIRVNWPRTLLWTVKALWISYGWYTRT